jgi:Tetratricopeptide repeat
VIVYRDHTDKQAQTGPAGGRVGEEETTLLAESAAPLIAMAARTYGAAVLAWEPDRLVSGNVAGMGSLLLARVFGIRGEEEPLPPPLAALVGDPADRGALVRVLLAVRQALLDSDQAAAAVDLVLTLRQALETGLMTESDTRLLKTSGVIQDTRAARDAYVAGRDIINNYYPEPTDSQLELVDVAIAKPSRTPDGERDDSPVLDVKVRNTGGQPAVLKRAFIHVHQAVRCGTMFGSMRLTPFGGHWAGAVLPVSATYDVAVPPPEDADGLRIPAEISQAVAAGDSDRFEIRLGMKPTFDAYAYLVTLELVYDGADRRVVSPPIAVGFANGHIVHTVQEMRLMVRLFQKDVSEIREGIDQELTARGLPIPDWDAAPPRGRAALPDGLLSVDGTGNLFDSGWPGIWKVTPKFWDPERSVARTLNDFERMYRELTGIITDATVVDKRLLSVLPQAQATLADLPELCAEFQVTDDLFLPEPSGEDEAPSVRQPADLLEKMVQGKDEGTELWARLRSEDEGTLWFLGQLLADEGRLGSWISHLGLSKMPGVALTTEMLDEFLRLHRLDAPEAFKLRRLIALQRKSRDLTGAVAALRLLANDMARVLGPEHPDTRALRLEMTDVLTAAEDRTPAPTPPADSVADQKRTMGPGNQSTLASRANRADRLGESGNARAAAAAWAELIPDLIRFFGPEHPNTLNSRIRLAVWLSKSGDETAAVAEFKRVLVIRIRVLGPEHPDTLNSRLHVAMFLVKSDIPATIGEYESVLAIQKRVLGPQHAKTLETQRSLEQLRRL